MTIVDELLATLSPLGLPCAQSQYLGDQPTYLVFQYAATPSCIAEDAPQYFTIAWTVHLFAPLDLDPWDIQAALLGAIHRRYGVTPARTDAAAQDTPATHQLHLLFQFETLVPLEALLAANAGA